MKTKQRSLASIFVFLIMIGCGDSPDDHIAVKFINGSLTLDVDEVIIEGNRSVLSVILEDDLEKRDPRKHDHIIIKIIQKFEKANPELKVIHEWTRVKRYSDDQTYYGIYLKHEPKTAEDLFADQDTISFHGFLIKPKMY